MALRPLNAEEGKFTDLPMSNGGSSATYAVGDMLTAGSGYYAAATAGQGADVTHVCMQAGTVTTDGTLLRAIRVQGVVFEADCDAVWSIADRGTYADVATASTIDPDASSDDIFFIERGVGTPEVDTKVIGWFVHGAPNS